MNEELVEHNKRVIRRILKVREGGLPMAGKIHHYSDRSIKIPQILLATKCKIGVEIGTYQGEFAEILCKNVPGLKLFCIDPYKGEPLSAYNKEAYEIAKSKLVPYDCEIIQKGSLDALHSFKDNSLDFVYIDGDHTFDGAMQDIIRWNRKIKTGGIMAGHDFIYRFDVGIVHAVLAYVQAHNLTWYLTSEKIPSWLWVKEELNFYTS